MNNTNDYIFIALELIKTKYGNTKNISIDNETLVNDYNYFLSNLYNVNDLNDISNLRQELSQYKENYKELNNHINEEINARIDKKMAKLEHVLNENTINMEPYVYKLLIDIIKE